MRILGLLLCTVTLLHAQARAAENAANATLPANSIAPKKADRNFFKLLEEIFTDFENDLKANQKVDPKERKIPFDAEIEIRNIEISENVPPSFKKQLELLLVERLTRFGETKVKRYSTKTQKLDAYFILHTNAMALSLALRDSEKETLLWSESYDSETTRAARGRRDLTDEERDRDWYFEHFERKTVLHPKLLTVFTSSSDGFSSALTASFRWAEQYDYGRKETGIEAGFGMGVLSLSGGSNASATTDATTANHVTLLFVQYWNFLGPGEDNLHGVRSGIFAAAGADIMLSYGSTLLVRGGYEWRWTKFWTLSAHLGYHPPATIVTEAGAERNFSAFEFGIGVGAAL